MEITIIIAGVSMAFLLDPVTLSPPRTTVNLPVVLLEPAVKQLAVATMDLVQVGTLPAIGY